MTRQYKVTIEPLAPSLLDGFLTSIVAGFLTFMVLSLAWWYVTVYLTTEQGE